MASYFVVQKFRSVYCRVATPFAGLHLGFSAAPLVCCIFRQCALRAEQFDYVCVCVSECTCARVSVRVGGWVVGCAVSGCILAVSSASGLLLTRCLLIAPLWLLGCICIFYIYSLYGMHIGSLSIAPMHPTAVGCSTLCCWLLLSRSSSLRYIHQKSIKTKIQKNALHVAIVVDVRTFCPSSYSRAYTYVMASSIYIHMYMVFTYVRI